MVLLKAGNHIISSVLQRGGHTLWKPGLEMCKHAGREPFGIVMVHSWGEHRPEQWGEKTQNRVEQCLRAWLNKFQWMGMWVKTRYSRMIPGNFATWLHEFWRHRLGKASLGCKRVRLHRLNFSYQWEMSHGLLIYGPGGQERDHAWRLYGEQWTHTKTYNFQGKQLKWKKEENTGEIMESTTFNGGIEYKGPAKETEK